MGLLTVGEMRKRLARAVEMLEGIDDEAGMRDLVSDDVLDALYPKRDHDFVVTTYLGITFDDDLMANE